MLMEIHASQTMYCRVKHLWRKDTYFHLILFLLFSDILNWNMTGAEITESVIKKSTKRLNHNHSVLSLSDPDRIQPTGFKPVTF